MIAVHPQMYFKSLAAPTRDVKDLAHNLVSSAFIAASVTIWRSAPAAMSRSEHPVDVLWIQPRQNGRGCCLIMLWPCLVVASHEPCDRHGDMGIIEWMSNVMPALAVRCHGCHASWDCRFVAVSLS